MENILRFFVTHEECEGLVELYEYDTVGKLN